MAMDVSTNRNLVTNRKEQKEQKKQWASILPLASTLPTGNSPLSLQALGTKNIQKHHITGAEFLNLAQWKQFWLVLANRIFRNKN